jgi:hypothetical protein
MIVQHFFGGTVSDKVTNRSDFDVFVALVGDAPVVEDVKVQLAWASISARLPSSQRRTIIPNDPGPNRTVRWGFEPPCVP